MKTNFYSVEGPFYLGFLSPLSPSFIHLNFPYPMQYSVESKNDAREKTQKEKERNANKNGIFVSA